MKSRKQKGNASNTPHTCEEDLTQQQHRSNAFSFLKNRFFHGHGNQQQQQQQQQQQHLRIESEKSTSSISTATSSNSPRPSTSSTRSVTMATKTGWSIDNNQIEDKQQLSRSFDDSLTTTTEIPKVLTPRSGLSRSGGNRPMSMMGLDSLLQQQTDLTINVTKPTDAFAATTGVTPRRRNSTTPTTRTTSSNTTITATTIDTTTTAEKRSSLIIIKEGYLFKKTDFKPFHKQTKLDRGWKLYRVVLRGHKFYLYKLTTESPLKSLFPSPHHHSLLTFPATAANTTTRTNNSLKLVKTDFDREAQQVLFSNGITAQGAIFMELNQVTMQPKREINLILTTDGFLYICTRASLLWKIDSKYSTAILKIEQLATPSLAEEAAVATSPSSFSSFNSSGDPYFSNKSNNSHSNGLLLFSISYMNRPSILGVYSTQHRDIGQLWISTFQNHPSFSSLNKQQSQQQSRPSFLVGSSSNSSTLQDSFRSLGGGGGIEEEEDYEDINHSNNNSSRMYDATQRVHPDLILHSDGGIKGGTLNALCHELLFTAEQALLQVFLTTYTTFTTGARVLTEFRLILSENNTLESKLLDIFMIWCRDFSLDVMGDVASVMISILEEQDLVKDRTRADQVKELVLETVTENGKRNCDFQDDNEKIISAEKSNALLQQQELLQEDQDFIDQYGNQVENITAYEIIDGKRRDSINLSNLLITGLTPAVFLLIEPTSFAQQICLFHFSKQKQYAQDLLNPLSYLPPRPQLSVQMLNALLFTTAYPHFLTKLIRNQVLIETQQQHQVTEQEQGECLLIRSRLLAHWIRIGNHLLELGDMTGWCAVAMGVCSVGIVRLRETWKAVDRDLVLRVQTEWVDILTKYGLFSQTIWAQGWQHEPVMKEFSRVLDIGDLPLQHDLGEGKCYQSLPFFGTIRQSVDRARKHVKKLLGPDLINFDECQCIYDAITTSLTHWKSKNKPLVVVEEEEQGRKLPIVGPLQSFFEYSITDLMSVPHDYKYLQECSLACEPRIFGQGFDRRKFSANGGDGGGTQPGNSDVAPPSTCSLVFPKILDDYSLLDLDHVATTPLASGLSCSNISSAPSHPFKKTHSSRKIGTGHSIRSIRSFLEDRSNKKQYAQSTHNIASLTSAYPSNSSLNQQQQQQQNPTTMSSPDISLSPTNRGVNRKAFRRRTYSFPPGSSSQPAITTLGARTASQLESENSKTWLGSLISNRHHRTYSTKALIEAHRKSRAAQYGHNGEIILSVNQGELVFKVVAAFLKKDAEEEENSCTDFQKKKAEQEQDASLLVTIKAGYLEHLVDTLIRGVLPYEEALKDQWQMMSLAEGLQHQVQPEKVIMDEEEYINVFFSTFRIYCSSVHLLDILRKRFMEAKTKCKAIVKKKKNSLILLETYFTPEGGSSEASTSTSSPTTSATAAAKQQQEVSNMDLYDWKKVADIQLRVLNLFMYWVEEHPYDFVDEIEISRYIGIFLTNAKQTLEEWRVPLSNYKYDGDQKEMEQDLYAKKTQHMEALTMAHTIEQRIIDLRTTFIRKNLSPIYDMKSIAPSETATTTDTLLSTTTRASGAEELYRQLTSGGTQQQQLRYHTTLQLATNKSIPLSISTRPRDTDAKSSLVDRFAPEQLLEQVDRTVRQLFNTVTMQDWIQTFDVFEAQSCDLYAWLPARKPSRTSRMSAALASVLDAPSCHIPNYQVLLKEDVIVSDIFTAIEGARRSVVSPSAFSDDDLFLAFPGSIQYLYCMHYIIRSWVMNEIAAMEIDSKTRVLRIEKFLQIVLLSKISSEKMTLFPELKQEESHGRVPGFVEYAIASALVSPEVRIFFKAWNDVAMQHGHANLDTLENLLNQIQKTQSSFAGSSRPTTLSARTFSSSSNSSSFGTDATQQQLQQQQQLVVPSLGWIFDRIMEMCFHIPVTFDKKENMINFDKRRCVYQFLQVIMSVQIDLDEQQVEAKGISMSFLLSPNHSQDNWKGLKGLAARENKQKTMGSSPSVGVGSGGAGSGSTGSSLAALRGVPSSSNKSPRSGVVFNKLVAEQMEKLKRDFKDRDRIDKEWLSLQHKLQKKQLEQARLVEKQDRKAALGGNMMTMNKSQSQQQLLGQQHGHSVMPRINSFLRGLRPQSMVASSSPTAQHPFDTSHQYLSSIKASTVINLIHSTTSVASTYTKRDFVFRIVTEEGGQYLFQAMNREDMYDWMQHVNNSAREGAAKRQSVLAAESLVDIESGNNQQQRRHTAILLSGASAGATGGSSNLNYPTTTASPTRTSVYGIHLDNLMRDGKVPLVVDKCIREIEKRGLEEVGIYRVAGTGSVVSALKAEFNKDVNKVDLGSPAWADINVVADAFKQFLRELPEPLLTYTYYDEFINASASEDHDERVYLIKKVIKKLPFSNYILLKRIIEHFVIVTDFEATNHMYATNLAIVFGPTLLQPTPGPASFATTMSNLGHHQNIVKYLILNYHYLFDVESDEVEIVSSSKEEEHQVTK